MTGFARQLPIVSALAVAIGLFGFAHLNRAQAEESCGSYGTSVVFVDSPGDAAKQATKEEKLVFVLHVSGHFEVSEYT